MAELDILTETEGKRAALGTDAPGHEADIAKLVTAISQRIDALCGPVVQREVTEIHDGADHTIWPRLTPVAEITAVTEWDGSSQTVLTADAWGTSGSAAGYFLEGASSTYGHGVRLLRRASGGSVRFAGSVQLVYLAGRFATTDDVDAKWKVAAQNMVRRVWDREASAWSRGADPFEPDLQTTSRFFRAIDPMIDEWLSDERLPPGIA